MTDLHKISSFQMYEHPAFCHNVLRTKNVLRAEEFPYGSNFNPRSQLSKIFQISIKKYSMEHSSIHSFANEEYLICNYVFKISDGNEETKVEAI